jgi:hypothetical protein
MSTCSTCSPFRQVGFFSFLLFVFSFFFFFLVGFSFLLFVFSFFFLFLVVFLGVFVSFLLFPGAFSFFFKAYLPELPDFALYDIPKREKYTKLTQNIPKGRKTDQRAKNIPSLSISRPSTIYP